MKTTSYFLLLLIFSLFTATKCKPDMNFTYTDGSNNSFYISPNNLKYEPIQPQFSNTGFYSGGEAKEIPLSEELYQELIRLAEAAIDDKASHPDNRPKGSGILSFYGQRIVLEMSSNSKNALEDRLRALIK